MRRETKIAFCSCTTPREYEESRAHRRPPSRRTHAHATRPAQTRWPMRHALMHSIHKALACSSLLPPSPPQPLLQKIIGAYRVFFDGLQARPTAWRHRKRTLSAMQRLVHEKRTAWNKKSLQIASKACVSVSDLSECTNYCGSSCILLRRRRGWSRRGRGVGRGRKREMTG
jgi:hypothetical protein